MSILVTGGTGMVGKALQSLLPEAIYTGSKDYDLMDYEQVENLFNHINPSTVVHLAAHAGGVVSNNKSPYNFFYNNLIINSHIINACLQFGTKYLIAMSSVCVYSPEIEQFPITEELSQKGEPDTSIYGYSYAKRMISVQLKCAQQQFGNSMQSVIINSSNLYGPNDCFDTDKMHVIPALICKFHNNINNPEVNLLGTGKALRQVTFVDDIARFIVFCIDKQITGEVNFASPDNLSIKEISETIASEIGFNGHINFSGGLDGILRRDVSIEKCRSFGFNQFTTLGDGIRKTYKWFKHMETNNAN